MPQEMSTNPQPVSIASLQERVRAYQDRLANPQPVSIASLQERVRAHQERLAHSRAQLQPVYKAAGEMAMNLGDRAKTLEQLRSLTPEQQAALPAIAQEVAKEHGQGPRIPVGTRVLEGLALGTTRTAQAIGELLPGDAFGTPGEIRTIQQLEASRDTEGPMAIARPEDARLARWTAQAAEMAPWAALVAASGGLAGGAAKAAGLGAGAVTAATTAGVTAASFPTEYRQSLAEISDMGVAPEKAAVAAAITALVSGTIESIVPDPFKAGKIPVKAGLRKALAAYTREALKRFPGELTEEGLQGIAHELGKVGASWMDDNVADLPVNAKDLLVKGVDDMVSAAGPLAVMMGAPAVARGVASTWDRSQPPPTDGGGPGAPAATNVQPPTGVPPAAPPAPPSDTMSPPVPEPPSPQPPTREMLVAQEIEAMGGGKVRPDVLAEQFYSAKDAEKKPLWYDDVKRLREQGHPWRRIWRELVTGGRFAESEREVEAADRAKQQEMADAFEQRRFENVQVEAKQLGSEGWKELPAGTTPPTDSFEVREGQFGGRYYRLRPGWKKLGGQKRGEQRAPDEQEPSTARPVGEVHGAGVPGGTGKGGQVGPAAGGVPGVPAGGQAEGAVAEPEVAAPPKPRLWDNVPAEVKSQFPDDLDALKSAAKTLGMKVGKKATLEEVQDAIAEALGYNPATKPPVQHFEKPSDTVVPPEPVGDTVSPAEPPAPDSDTMSLSDLVAAMTPYAETDAKARYILGYLGQDEPPEGAINAARKYLADKASEAPSEPAGATEAEAGVESEEPAETPETAAGEPVVESEAKPPWQMTRDEWQGANRIRRTLGGAGLYDAKTGEIFSSSDVEDVHELVHRAAETGDDATLGFLGEIRAILTEQVERDLAEPRDYVKQGEMSPEEFEALRAERLSDDASDSEAEELLAEATAGTLVGRRFDADLQIKLAGIAVRVKNTTTIKSHRQIVRDALAAGEPVPPEVLADYPDLAPKKKLGKKTAAAESWKTPETEDELKSLEEKYAYLVLEALDRDEGRGGKVPSDVAFAALRNAIQKFDPSKGKPFENYARSAIARRITGAYRGKKLGAKSMSEGVESALVSRDEPLPGETIPEDTQRSPIQIFLEDDAPGLSDAEVQQRLYDDKAWRDPEIDDAVEWVQGQDEGVRGRLEPMLRKIQEGRRYAAKQKKRAKKLGRKQPWQMTQAEYVKAYPGDGGAVTPGFVHRKLVFDALVDGKPVQDNVLADYPDLKEALRRSKVEGESKLVVTEGKLVEGASNKPFGDVSVDQEGKFYGARVEVAPQGRTQEGYTGTVHRVLNGGTLIEVQPDGQETTFRVKGERVTVLEGGPLKTEGKGETTAAEPEPEEPSTRMTEDEAVASLSPEDRDLFMRRKNGESIAKIARSLGVPRKEAQKQYNRVAKLVDRLQIDKKAQARNRAANKASKEAVREDAKQAAEQGEASKRVAVYAPLHTLPAPVRESIQQGAQVLLNETESPRVRAALEKIIKDAGKDVGAGVEEQKERIVEKLAGERGGANRLDEPWPVDPIVSMFVRGEAAGIDDVAQQKRVSEQVQRIDMAINELRSPSGFGDETLDAARRHLEEVEGHPFIDDADVLDYLQGLRKSLVGEPLLPTGDTMSPAGEQSENVPFFRVDAPKKLRGRGISREVVAQVFPGARITKAKRGWYVEIGDSVFEIEVVDELRLNKDAVERQLGRKLKKHELQALQGAASYQLKLPDGTKVGGLGLIRLVEGRAAEKHLIHEMVHLAWQTGLLGETEKALLTKEHFDPKREGDVEEQVAIGIERTLKLGEPVPILTRIETWIRKLLQSWGFDALRVQDVYNLLRSAGYWAKAKTPGDTLSPERYALGTVADTLAAEGRSYKRADEFAEAWAKTLRKVGTQYKGFTKTGAISQAGLSKAVDEAIRDIQPWLQDNAHHKEYYASQAKVEREALEAVFPEMAEDEAWAFYKLVGAIASNSTTLKENVTEQMDAWASFRQRGRFDVSFSRSKRGSAKLGKTAFGLHGGAQAVKAQHYVGLNTLLERHGSMSGVLNYLLGTIPHTQLRALPSEIGSGPMSGKQVRQIRDTVHSATGQDTEIPRLFMFGPKLGAYAMNNLGQSEYTTVDVWESRFWRSYFSDVPESTGLENDSATRALFKLASNKMAEKLGGTPSSLQAVRWYYIIDTARRAGYTKAQSNETIADYTRRQVEQRVGTGQGGVPTDRRGQDALPRGDRTGGEGGRLRSALGDAFFARYSLQRNPELYGRPDLANPGETPGARDLIDEIDERRNEEGRPGYHSWEEAEAEADAMLARDWDGTRQRILDAGRRGEPLDDTWTAAAQKIYNAEYQAAIRSGDAKALEDVIQFGEAYRDIGSAAAKSMAIRRDRIESPMERIARVLSLAITTPPERQRRKRDALRKQGREAQKRGDAAGAKDAFTAADKINADWARKFAELKAKLKLLGVDLDNLNDLGYSKIKAAEALGHIARHKADRSDKFYEYWRNSILSAFTTQAANLLGNTGHSSWHFTAERFVEALVNLGVGDPMSAQFGEFKYLLGGVLPGLSRGARNFLLSWRLESPMLEYEIGREGQWKWEEPDTAIAGKKGKIIRWPQRLLLAADEFSKSLFTEMEAGAYAYRIAKMEGKKGDALRQRIAALVADTQSKAWDFAHESSLELTFQQKGGKVAQAVKTHVLSARRDLWGVRYLIPFVTTPTNIFATGIRKSPAGTPLLLWKLGEKMHANHKAGKSVFDGMNENVARPLAEQVIAWGLVLALMALTDPDDPILTGSTGEYNAADREVGYRTRPTQSVRLGDTWYSYSRLEPFATVLGLTIDWINAVRTGDPNEITDVPIDSLAGQLKNKTFLSGVGDILRALESEKSSEKFVQWLSSFGTSWVPNAARSISRESDDYYMNRRVWGREGEWKKRLGKRTLQKTELVGSVIRDYPIYDVWGRPAQRSEAPVGSDFLWRIIMPIRTQKADMFVADRAIINYNNQQPDDERFPRSPAPYYRKGDETVYMSDGQYADFALLAGQAAVAGLSGETVQINADNPTKAHVEWINDVTTKARSKVRELLVKRWAGEKVEIDPEAIGRDVADDALASLAWTAAESPQYTEEAQAAAGKLRDLGVDNRTLSSVLAWKKAKAGHKTSSIGAWQRRLFARLAQAKP